MKTIIVPTDADAAGRLDRGEDREGDLIEVRLTAEAFDRLFASGWVRSVNGAVGCNIDDFEDEHVSDPASLDTVADITRRMIDEDGGEPFPQIAALADEAKKRGTGLHFYF